MSQRTPNQYTENQFVVRDGNNGQMAKPQHREAHSSPLNKKGTLLTLERHFPKTFGQGCWLEQGKEGESSIWGQNGESSVNRRWTG